MTKSRDVRFFQRPRHSNEPGALDPRTGTPCVGPDLFAALAAFDGIDGSSHGQCSLATFRQLCERINIRVDEYAFVRAALKPRTKHRLPKQQQQQASSPVFSREERLKRTVNETLLLVDAERQRAAEEEQELQARIRYYFGPGEAVRKERDALTLRRFDAMLVLFSCSPPATIRALIELRDADKQAQMAAQNAEQFVKESLGSLSAAASMNGLSSRDSFNNVAAWAAPVFKRIILAARRASAAVSAIASRRGSASGQNTVNNSSIGSFIRVVTPVLVSSHASHPITPGVNNINLNNNNNNNNNSSNSVSTSRRESAIDDSAPPSVPLAATTMTPPPQPAQLPAPGRQPAAATATIPRPPALLKAAAFEHETVSLADVARVLPGLAAQPTFRNAWLLSCAEVKRRQREDTAALRHITLPDLLLRSGLSKATVTLLSGGSGGAESSVKAMTAAADGSRQNATGALAVSSGVAGGSNNNNNSLSARTSAEREKTLAAIASQLHLTVRALTYNYNHVRSQLVQLQLTDAELARLAAIALMLKRYGAVAVAKLPWGPLTAPAPGLSDFTPEFDANHDMQGSPRYDDSNNNNNDDDDDKDDEAIETQSLLNSSTGSKMRRKPQRRLTAENVRLTMQEFFHALNPVNFAASFRQDETRVQLSLGNGSNNNKKVLSSSPSSAAANSRLYTDHSGGNTKRSDRSHRATASAAAVADEVDDDDAFADSPQAVASLRRAKKRQLEAAAAAAANTTKMVNAIDSDEGDILEFAELDEEVEELFEEEVEQEEEQEAAGNPKPQQVDQAGGDLEEPTTEPQPTMKNRTVVVVTKRRTTIRKKLKVIRDIYSCEFFDDEAAELREQTAEKALLSPCVASGMQRQQEQQQQLREDNLNLAIVAGASVEASSGKTNGEKDFIDQIAILIDHGMTQEEIAGAVKVVDDAEERKLAARRDTHALAAEMRVMLQTMRAVQEQRCSERRQQLLLAAMQRPKEKTQRQLEEEALAEKNKRHAIHQLLLRMGQPADGAKELSLELLRLALREHKRRQLIEAMRARFGDGPVDEEALEAELQKRNGDGINGGSSCSDSDEGERQSMKTGMQRRGVKKISRKEHFLGLLARQHELPAASVFYSQANSISRDSHNSDDHHAAAAASAASSTVAASELDARQARAALMAMLPARVAHRLGQRLRSADTAEKLLGRKEHNEMEEALQQRHLCRSRTAALSRRVANYRTEEEGGEAVLAPAATDEEELEAMTDVERQAVRVAVEEQKQKKLKRQQQKLLDSMNARMFFPTPPPPQSARRHQQQEQQQQQQMDAAIVKFDALARVQQQVLLEKRKQHKRAMQLLDCSITSHPDANNDHDALRMQQTMLVKEMCGDFSIHDVTLSSAAGTTPPRQQQQHRRRDNNTIDENASPSSLDATAFSSSMLSSPSPPKLEIPSTSTVARIFGEHARRKSKLNKRTPPSAMPILRPEVKRKMEKEMELHAARKRQAELQK